MQRLNELDARHLLVRTGFTPSQAELAPFVGLSAEAAVSRILQAAQRKQFKEFSC